MNNSRFKEKLIVLLFAIISPLFVLNTSKALDRPPNPLMDYVPQSVGIYDTYYENFKENDCRVCHGSSTAERHHISEYAVVGNCSFCHSAMTLPYIEGDSGWKSGTSFSQVCSEGIHLWHNLSNVQSNEGIGTYCNIDDTDPTCYLDIKGFDFSSIPDIAQIKGIQVYIKGKVNEPNWRGWDDFIKLLKAGKPVGNNKATISRIWPQSWKTQYYGSGADYWDTSWTLVDIKNPGFGLRLRFYNTEDEAVRIEIDHVAIKIYYQLPQEKSDCKICHIDGGPIGDFGSPHHNSDLASSGKCNECHPHVVEINSVPQPTHEPSSITPTPYSCENCHWPSGNTPHQPATYDGNILNFLEDWKSWIGNPLPTTWPDGLDHPKPIEANGPVFSGALNERPYRPDDGTHHKIGGRVYNQCSFCHDTTPVNISNWRPSNPYLIRYCENCHSVDSLHSIQEHVSDNTIYRINGIGSQAVTADEKCIGCHNGSMPENFLLPKDVPVIDHIEPNFGLPGITVNIYPASGICFNEDPINGLCSFGQKFNGDKVIMGQYDSNGDLYWVNVPILSWSEYLIQIIVPEQTFEPGKTIIKVHKENLGTSPLKVFVVLHNPNINSLTPSSRSWGQDVLVSGNGFPMLKEKIYLYNENGYGYSTYIELHSSDNKYRITRYYREDPLNPDIVFIGLTDLLNVNTGNPVTEQDLYSGCWDTKIVIDYFKDNPTNGTPGKYNLGMDGLDPADELLYRIVSNSVCLTVTNDFSYNEFMIDNISSEETFEVNEINLSSHDSITYILGGNSYVVVDNNLEQYRALEEPSLEIQKSLEDEKNNLMFGLTVQDLTPEIIKRLNLPNKQGVFVSDISEDSQASSVFMEEDVILKINQTNITNLEDYNKILDTIKLENDITILLLRNSSILHIILSYE